MYENTFVGRVDRFRIYGFYEDRLEELLSIIPYEVVNKWNNSKVTWFENTSTGQKKKKKESVNPRKDVGVGCWKCTHLGMQPTPTSVTSIRRSTPKFEWHFLRSSMSTYFLLLCQPYFDTLAVDSLAGFTSV